MTMTHFSARSVSANATNRFGASKDSAKKANTNSESQEKPYTYKSWAAYQLKFRTDEFGNRVGYMEELPNPRFPNSQSKNSSGKTLKAKLFEVLPILKKLEHHKKERS